MGLFCAFVSQGYQGLSGWAWLILFYNFIFWMRIVGKIGILVLMLAGGKQPELGRSVYNGSRQLSNISKIYNINFQMRNQAVLVQRQTRGGSRSRINYVDNLKNSAPYYGSSIKKPSTNYFQTGIMKNSSKPTYESTLKNPSRDQNTRVYSYLPTTTYADTKLKQKDTKYGLISAMNDSDTKADRNQQFRIRSNVKENLANSRKTQKDEEQRLLQKQKQLAESKRTYQQLKLERQKEQNYQRLLKQKQQREQKQKQAAKKMSELDQFRKKIDEIKPISSMTNSTTTGASDYSSSSLRNGGTSYSYSTSSSKTIGLVGLNNIGNTCFMNSILQCMFNLPGFNDYFLYNKYEDEIKAGGRVAEAYAKTIKTIRSSTARSQTPSQLKNAIGSKKSRFMGYSQQDAQQLLAALLQLLSLDLNRSKNPKYKQLTADLSKQTLKQISDDWWSYNKQRQDSIVCDYFSGQVLSRVVCSKCRTESIAFDNIWDMALNFSPNDGGDILKMIQNFLKEEIISDDYYCSKCKALRPCERKIDFYRLPQILVFQLKRFSYGRFKKTKLNTRVHIQTTLNLSSLITESTHQSVKNPIYNLVGVVNHSGDIDFGHYTAQCRNPINGKWYDFNDSSVNQVRIREEFQSSSPYVLFYAKQDICR